VSQFGKRSLNKIKDVNISMEKGIVVNNDSETKISTKELEGSKKIEEDEELER